MSSTIQSSHPEPPEKSFGQKLKEFFSSPVLVLMTLGAVALVLGVPYMALRTLPGIHNPFTGEAPAAKADPNVGIDFNVLGSLPEDLAYGAREILAQEEPALPELLQGLEPPSEIGLIYPITEAVESVQPALSWTMFAEGPYEVAVYDGARMEVVRVRNLGRLSWVVPKPLTRGADYRWQVTAANKTSLSASFTVLTEEQVEQWQQVRSELKDAHLALGVAAEQLGLLTIAEREYQELARQFPKAEAPARLLDNVLALRE